MLRISELPDDWGEAGMDDKRAVVDALIERISATSEKVDIEWKI
jgi:hypothetical protein